MGRARRGIVRGGLASLALLLAVGCGQTTAVPPGATSLPSGSAPVSDAPSTVPTAGASTTTDPADVPNDLASGRLRRVIRSGGLEFTATYSTTVKGGAWSAGRQKPLRVVFSVNKGGGSTQKVYLSRVTANVTSSDAEGPVDSPKSIVDAADIRPGFLVNFPYSYEQNFLLPGVDTSATSVTVALNYELLYRVGSKDYGKQSLTDQLTVPVS